jgi:hypothetical protein
MVILEPLVRRPLHRLLFILSFMLSFPFDRCGTGAAIVLPSGVGVCFDVLGRVERT